METITQTEPIASVSVNKPKIEQRQVAAIKPSPNPIVADPGTPNVVTFGLTVVTLGGAEETLACTREVFNRVLPEGWLRMFNYRFMLTLTDRVVTAVVPQEQVEDMRAGRPAMEEPQVANRVELRRSISGGAFSPKQIPAGVPVETVNQVVEQVNRLSTLPTAGDLLGNRFKVEEVRMRADGVSIIVDPYHQ